jgi:hypothetical protein
MTDPRSLAPCLHKSAIQSNFGHLSSVHTLIPYFSKFHYNITLLSVPEVDFPF